MRENAIFIGKSQALIEGYRIKYAAPGTSMLVKPDRRKHYGETRYIGLGQIQGRIMVIVYTERKRDVCRIISLRKANRREQKTFEKAVKDKLDAP